MDCHGYRAVTLSIFPSVLFLANTGLRRAAAEYFNSVPQKRRKCFPRPQILASMFAAVKGGPVSLTVKEEVPTHDDEVQVLVVSPRQDIYSYWQCCGCLSRILIFTHPGSRIQKQHTFFVATNFT
jgi:hypothetical protein